MLNNLIFSNYFYKIIIIYIIKNLLNFDEKNIKFIKISIFSYKQYY